MAEETNTTAVNDNTNAPQTQTETASQPATGAEATDTMLGGNGTTEQQKTEEAQAPVTTPEAYDFTQTIPEGVDMDEALTKDFSDMARGMNLSNEQANQMAAFGIKYGQQVADAVHAQYNAEVTKWGEEAKAELGSNLNSVMSTAGAGIEAVEKAVPGIRKALNETGAGNRIEVIRAFEMLGKLVQADPGKLINSGTAPEQGPAKTWYPNSKF